MALSAWAELCVTEDAAWSHLTQAPRLFRELLKETGCFKMQLCSCRNQSCLCSLFIPAHFWYPLQGWIQPHNLGILSALAGVVDIVLSETGDSVSEPVFLPLHCCCSLSICCSCRVQVTVLETIYSELWERSSTLGCLDVFISSIISWFILFEDLPSQYLF